MHKETQLMQAIRAGNENTVETLLQPYLAMADARDGERNKRRDDVMRRWQQRDVDGNNDEDDAKKKVKLENAESTGVAAAHSSENSNSAAPTPLPQTCHTEVDFIDLTCRDSDDNSTLIILASMEPNSTVRILEMLLKATKMYFLRQEEANETTGIGSENAEENKPTHKSRKDASSRDDSNNSAAPHRTPHHHLLTPTQRATDAFITLLNDMDNRDGITALSIAAFYGKVKHVKLLLRYGDGDVMDDDEGGDSTAASSAATSVSLPTTIVVRPHIKQSITLFDHEGSSPLHRAIGGGGSKNAPANHHECLRMLLAFWPENPDCMFWRLKRNQNDDEDCEEEVSTHQQQQQQPDVEEGRPPMATVPRQLSSQAPAFIHFGDLTYGELIFDDAEEEDESGFYRITTPLAAAARCGDIDGMKILIAAGANVHHSRDGNQSLLHLAARNTAPDTVEFLLSPEFAQNFGLDVNQIATGYPYGTPLKFAREAYDLRKPQVDQYLAKEKEEGGAVDDSSWHRRSVFEGFKNAERIVKFLREAGGVE